MKKSNDIKIVILVFILSYGVVFAYLLNMKRENTSDTISSQDYISSNIIHNINQDVVIDYLRRIYFLGEFAYSVNYNANNYDISNLGNDYFLESAIRNTSMSEEDYYPEHIPYQIVENGVKSLFGNDTKFIIANFSRNIDNCSINIEYNQKSNTYKSSGVSPIKASFSTSSSCLPRIVLVNVKDFKIDNNEITFVTNNLYTNSDTKLIKKYYYTYDDMILDKNSVDLTALYEKYNDKMLLPNYISIVENNIYNYINKDLSKLKTFTYKLKIMENDELNLISLTIS